MFFFHNKIMLTCLCPVALTIEISIMPQILAIELNMYLSRNIPLFDQCIHFLICHVIARNTGCLRVSILRPPDRYH